MLLDALSREDISVALGYSSIFAWLFAQMPQVYKNYMDSSVEGLALPFLVSWLAGDFTNLIGCILTHQLYTQRVLAVYFVGVDVALMSQYIYYSSKHPIPSLPPLSESYPHAQAPEGHHQHHHSHSRRPHKRRRRSGATSGSRTKSTSAGGDDPMTRSWMSEASTTTHSPTSSRQNTTAYSSQDVSRQPSRQPSAHFTWSTTFGSAASTEPPSPTLPERGRTLTRPPRPSVPALETISGSPASGSPVPGLHHVNFHGEVETLGEESRPNRHRPTSSTSRSRPPPPSRRATSSMLFLSVGLLVTFSKWSGATGILERDLDGVAWEAGAVGSAVEPVSTSRVWEELRHPSFFRYNHAESAAPALPSRHGRRQTFPIAVSLPAVSYTATRDVDAQADQPKDDEPHWHDKDGEPHRYPKRDWERFIGRASAWMCTTLYLTSRLPQIWQNFRRRSVEGLSMLLFTMAFVGNSLYVASILTSPLMGTPGYLLETLPFLLGSGGTLMFDASIGVQSWLYSEKRKAAQERSRRRRHLYGLDAEEEAALLDGETEDEVTETETDDGLHSRSASIGPTRSRSSRRTLSRKGSDSTELGTRKAGSRSRSRASRDRLEDRRFDFDAASRASGSGERGSPSVSANASRGGTRASSVASSKLVEIAEQGESTVTLR